LRSPRVGKRDHHTQTLTTAIHSQLTAMNALPIHIPPTFKVTQEQFKQIAAANRDMRLERNAPGELLIMPATHRGKHWETKHKPRRTTLALEPPN
jgi:hypothetical protein